MRNELRRAQFSLTPAFTAFFRQLHHDRPAAEVEQALDELRKLEGGFAAQATFNDWVGHPGPILGAPGMLANGIVMMGCCPPEGMRGFWEAWQGTVDVRSDGIYVHLPFTREHAAARVTAFHPADGGFTVMARQESDYFLRPPDWADRATVLLRRAGQPVATVWSGQVDAYLLCRAVRAGEQLTVRWPGRTSPRFSRHKACRAAASR